MAAIHLYQLPEMLLPFSTLSIRAARSAASPQPGLLQPPPQGVVVDCQPFCAQVLGSQRRAKAFIALPIAIENPLLELIIDGVVGSAPLPPLYQAVITLRPIAKPDPTGLAVRQLQDRRRVCQGDLFLFHFLQHLHSSAFLATQSKFLHPSPPSRGVYPVGHFC
jgi:hypothetical protein